MAISENRILAYISSEEIICIPKYFISAINFFNFPESKGLEASSIKN